MTFENFCKKYIKKGSENPEGDFAEDYLRQGHLHTDRPHYWRYNPNPLTWVELRAMLPFGVAPEVTRAGQKLFKRYLKQIEKEKGLQ